MPNFQHPQLSSLLTEDGDIDRRVDVLRWGLPHNLELRKDRLYWEEHPFDSGVLFTRPAAGMLERFLKLADAPDRRILDFAAKYGVLGICRHGLPAGHNSPLDRTCVHTVPAGRRKGCYVPTRREKGKSFLWEPLSAWRALSHEALILANIADGLVRGELGERDDWRAVCVRARVSFPWSFERLEYKASLGVRRFILAEATRAWLVMGNVRPTVIWESAHKKPSVQLSGRGLFGALAVQLALAIGQSAGYGICDHCRAQYAPEKRRPKVGQRHFCPLCRKKGIPNRYSMMDYRERLRRQSEST